jgi:hypothetical protein
MKFASIRNFLKNAQTEKHSFIFPERRGKKGRKRNKEEREKIVSSR